MLLLSPHTWIYGQIHKSTALDYVSSRLGTFAKADISQDEIRILSSHTSSISGVEHIYIQQTRHGIDIKDAYASLHIDAQGTILHEQNNFVEVAESQRLLRPTFTSSDAVNSTAQHFNLPQNALLSQDIRIANKGDYQVFSNTSLSPNDIRIKPIYIYVEGALTLTQEVVIDLPDKEERWALYIDATTGDVLKEEPLFLACNFGSHQSCSHHTHDKRENDHVDQISLITQAASSSAYNVYAIPLESPSEGSRSIVADPWLDAHINGIQPSPYGWHDLDGLPGADTTITYGNNVNAVEDVDADNAGGASPDGGASLLFNFPINLNQNPETYIPGATVNLFYMNNIMHDVMMHYGFDEAAGNFQEVNYTGNGQGADLVRAESQDGSGTNNALFFANVDGFGVRMQMYQWTPRRHIEITSPAELEGNHDVGRALFGPQDLNVSGEISVVDPMDGCTDIMNPDDIAGKIAMIDRGGCQFDQKTRRAEDEGAIAVIICNYENQGIISMSGDDTTITIPTVMLPFETCQSIRVNIANGVTADVNLDGLNTDSDLDNGIIAHEYAHGISQRLTGGAGQLCLSGAREQMGEGWSDYYALMLQLKERDLPTDINGIGSYVLGQGTDGAGIRPYPYTTDMAINPFTYNDIADVSVPHGVGSIWCTMLWDMTWNLIEKHGFEPNIYKGQGGNGIAMKLVTEGLKLQSCQPGFIDGRDAIIKADSIMYGGSNSCEIWRAFAKRGLGVGAEQGDSNDVTDGTESFDIPDGCPATFLEPCSEEHIDLSGITIPDSTDVKVMDKISIDSSQVAALSGVTLQSQVGIEITAPFEVATSGVLLIKTAPCAEND